MRLIVDGNSYLNAALLGGTDHEDGRKVDGVQVNSAQYGVDRFFERIREILERLNLAPRNIVLVWDGKNSKVKRQKFILGYKSGRDKTSEVNVELNKAREVVTQGLLDLGAHVVSQEGVEADDVIAYLVQNLKDEHNIVCSDDGDLSVLFDGITHVWSKAGLNKNPFGNFPNKHITVYKALVGDPSDKIPGARGFGEVAFEKMLKVFGSSVLDDFREMLDRDVLRKDKDPFALDELEGSLAHMPELKKVLANKEEVLKAYQAAKLHPEWVNTLDKPWDLKAGLLKQRSDLSDGPVLGLQHFYGHTNLVVASNYEEVKLAFGKRVKESPFVALDIETSTSQESDEWTERVAASSEGKPDKMDVLGHELTGCALTFGENNQYTIYMSVDHADTDNITVDQCREMIELIPKKIPIVIQNRHFEFTVLYRTWGDKWANNGWHGFIPNAIDTLIGGSYVNENLPLGLKQRSLHHLGYAQKSYEEVTCKDDLMGNLKGGRIKKAYTVKSEQGVDYWRETRQYKMNELTAQEVIYYGADDTICTAALHNHYQLVMQLEGTWKTYLEVEQMPEYLTSLAFVQGVPLNLAVLKDLEKKDDTAYEAAWQVVEAYLTGKNWEGVSAPQFGEINAEMIQLALSFVTDPKEAIFTSRKRKRSALARDIWEQFPHNSETEWISELVEDNKLRTLQEFIDSNFAAKPTLNFGSPKQLQKFLYETIGATPRIFNKLTDKQKENDALKSAFEKQKWIQKGGKPEVTDDERKLWISKASTDDDAIALAIAKDGLPARELEVLKAFQEIKKIETRRGLFYKPYKLLPHWRDGRMHPSLNQSATTTRRYSSSNPNVQQLDKDSGFRSIIVPHDKGCVVVSLDFKGQELRLSAELSGDEAMTSCFVGDNLRDMHALTAATATTLLWKEEIGYEAFTENLASEDSSIKAKAKALRSQAKTVNFASLYGAGAAKIALTLGVENDVAENLLNAKYAAFPGFERWKLRVEESAKKSGFVLSMLGARRHLDHSINSKNWSEASRASRQASNYAIQSSAAEMMKLALKRMWQQRLFASGYDAKFYFSAHDEVVFSVHKDDAVDCIRDVYTCMVYPYATMKIPIESSISLGKSFGEQIECGDVFDAWKIQSVLEKLFGKETANA